MSFKSRHAELVRLEAAVMKWGEERRARVVRLRREGLTWQAIGDKLGVSRQRAQAMGAKAGE